MNASSQEFQWPGFGAVNLEICRPLGRGAFGEVFLVRAAPTEESRAGERPAGGDQLLALKRVSVGQLSEAGAEKALEEARLLQRLGKEHKSILQCFDFRLLPAGTTPGTAQPVLELLLEFAPLGDLSHRIRAHRDAQAEVGRGLGLPEMEVIAYGRDLAAGLAHLHALRPKVFHRDVKPANVVLFYGKDEANGQAGVPRAKLADFGIAKVLECEGTLAGAATVIGTPHYFSPEICRGERYDERADAWAMGCVLYEMVCLRRPFHQFEANIAVLALRISEGKYDTDTLKRQASAYNGLLIFTLFGLLTKDQEHRSRASDAAQSLQDLQNETTQSTAEKATSWWQEQTAERDASAGERAGREEPGAQEDPNANLNGDSDSWGGAFAAEVPDVVTQRPSELPTEQRASGSQLDQLDDTVVTELPCAAGTQSASLDSGAQADQLNGTVVTELPCAARAHSASLDSGRRTWLPEEPLAGTAEQFCSSGIFRECEAPDEVRPFSALPRHDAPLTVRSIFSDVDGEHGTGGVHSAQVSPTAEQGMKHFATAPRAPPLVGLSRESSAPQTEMLGEVFHASGHQSGGSAARCAWAGAPEMQHPTITTPVPEGEGRPSTAASASTAGTRLLLRPLWQPGASGAVDSVDAPVVFRFQPIMRHCDALPSADGTALDAVGAQVVSSQAADPGWLEVHFMADGGEIVVPSVEADDRPIFSLTSVE